jgi:hypothetical protein
MDQTTRAALHRESGFSGKDFSGLYLTIKDSLEREKRVGNGGEVMRDLEGLVDRYVDEGVGEVFWGDGEQRWRYPEDRALYSTPLFLALLRKRKKKDC